MHTVFRFLRQLLLTVLLLALLPLVAAGGYFAVTGHKLYESAIQVTPIDTLYSSISSREGFVPYAQLPQPYINAVISALFFICYTYQFLYIPLVLLNKSMRSAVGWLYMWKNTILVITIILSIMIYRPFCKYICPLGAFYSVFNKVSVFRY